MNQLKPQQLEKILARMFREGRIAYGICRECGNPFFYTPVSASISRELCDIHSDRIYESKKANE